MTLEIVGALLLLGLAVIWKVSLNAAYRNGVVDGYGFSQEPYAKGYQKAGWYLYQTHRERWPAIREHDFWGML